jgi:tripartite-type tricarboxylate transporter receptor subunit TctC
MTRLPLVVSVLLICLSPAFAQQAPLQKKIMLAVGGRYSTPDELVAHSLTSALEDVTGQRVVSRTSPDPDRVPAFNRDTAGNEFQQLLLVTSENAARLDFIPVAPWIQLPLVMMAAPGLQARRLVDFMAYAKANPDALSYAHLGAGTISQMAAEDFRRTTGLNIKPVQFDSGDEAVEALILGKVQLMLAPILWSIEVAESGRVRVYATSGRERSPLLPEASLMSDAIPGYSYAPWFGVGAMPGSTQQDIAVLRSAIEAAAKSPKNDQTFRSQGYERLSMGPAEFAALVDKTRKEAVSAATAVEQAPVVMPEKMVASFGVCGLPLPARNEQLIIVDSSTDGMKSPVALSTIDRSTEIRLITIEDGNSPIYLMLMTASPIIYVFDGAVERLSHVTAVQSSYGARDPEVMAGIVGIPKGKISFGREAGCFGSAYVWGSKWGSETRKTPGYVWIEGANYFRTSVPSGKQEARPRGTLPSQPQFSDERRIGELKIEDVIAQVPVIPYGVLQSQPGIRQLEQEGYIVKTRRMTYPDEYKIIREFPRYPLGLSGGDSVQFILGAGLKEPEGDLGHSCIRSETTGLPLHPSPMCRP